MEGVFILVELMVHISDRPAGCPCEELLRGNIVHFASLSDFHFCSNLKFWKALKSQLSAFIARNGLTVRNPKRKMCFHPSGGQTANYPSLIRTTTARCCIILETNNELNNHINSWWKVKEYQEIAPQASF